MQTFFDYLAVLGQKLTPRHAVTALTYRLARVRHQGFKNFLIRRFVSTFDVDLDEVPSRVPDDFATFNDFFIRELAEGARPIDADATAIVSPADGTVSAAGMISGQKIFQAKGIDYTLQDLLATDLHNAEQFTGGAFATIYLAPYNYHRVHSPLAGTLRAAHYVPGDLYSVNARTARALPGVFTRNERVILHCDTKAGQIAVILVGALNVGSISTVWHGEIRPRKSGVVEDLPIRGGATPQFDKGATLGWFNMGSTVIVLLPPNVSDSFGASSPGSAVRMGECIGRLADTA